MPMGVRRLLSLVKHLPQRAAAVRERIADGADWTATEELLASVIELTDLTNRLIFAANAKKGQKPWKPLKIPRPYAKRDRRQTTGRELAEFIRRGGVGRVRHEKRN